MTNTTTNAENHPMQILKIELLNLRPEHMGDDATEADAAGYREWIAEQMRGEFPDAEIIASDERSTYSVRVSVADENDYEAALGMVCQLAERLWDTCPWSWVNAA